MNDKNTEVERIVSLVLYLQSHFLTKGQVLRQSNLTRCDFERLQRLKVIPNASYTLILSVATDSFFGEYKAGVDGEEYYPIGILSWLEECHQLSDQQSAQSYFSKRYLSELRDMHRQGYELQAAGSTIALSRHIEREWFHFLEGDYGVCTRSGSISEVVRKALAIEKITRLKTEGIYSQWEEAELNKAVSLLDQVSAYFAPHEYEKSSRAKFIDGINI